MSNAILTIFRFDWTPLGAGEALRTELGGSREGARPAEACRGRPGPTEDGRADVGCDLTDGGREEGRAEAKEGACEAADGGREPAEGGRDGGRDEGRAEAAEAPESTEAAEGEAREEGTVVGVLMEGSSAQLCLASASGFVGGRSLLTERLCFCSLACNRCKRF